MQGEVHHPTVESITGFDRLTSHEQEQLHAMASSMIERELPPAVILSGLKSTIQLLLEQHEAETPRTATDPVQRFLAENNGSLVSHSSRAVPRRETKLVDRERLREQVRDLLRDAHASKRRHEIKRVRRDILALDQNHIRRTLGSEGDTLLREINQWLIDVASQFRGS